MSHIFHAEVLVPVSLLLLLPSLHSSDMATHTAKHTPSSREVLLNGSGQELPLAETAVKAA